jgi:methyltransferase (TIGR00027 family)
MAARLRVFEVDQPGPQAWKRQRLIELGYGIHSLRLVPADFETSESWWEQLSVAGFDPGHPAVVVSTGVTMYLTKDATAATLRQIAGLAPGSTLAMTFLLPAELLHDADRSGLQATEKGARASGTPFISFTAAASRGPNSATSSRSAMILASAKELTAEQPSGLVCGTGRSSYRHAIGGLRAEGSPVDLAATRG